MKNTEIFNIFFKMYKETLDEKSALEEIKNSRNKYENFTINEFFLKYLKKKNFAETCPIFYRFYEWFCESARITDFFGKSFYLEL